jgi:excisionase family DNA binding protein
MYTAALHYRDSDRELSRKDTAVTADQLRIDLRAAAARPPKRAAATRPGANAQRITLSIEEAAAALGVSRDHLERHVLAELRVIYSGRRRLIPVSELARWADRQAVARPVPRRP